MQLCNFSFQVGILYDKTEMGRDNLCPPKVIAALILQYHL